MTTAEDTTEQAIAAGYHASTGDAPAGTSPFGGLADRVMRVPWLWPALLTLLLGIYQLGLAGCAQPAACLGSEILGLGRRQW